MHNFDINSITSKVVDWVGESFSIGKTTSVDKKTVTQTLDVATLSSLFPYDRYDEAASIFFNKKSAGFVLEGAPLTGASEEMINILASLVTDLLPDHFDAQVMLWASPKIGHILNAWKKPREDRGGMLAQLARQRVNYFGEGALNSRSKSSDLILRDFRLLLSISAPMKHFANDSAVSTLVGLRDQVTSQLQSMNLSVQTLPIENFIGMMQDLIQPTSHLFPSKANWDALNPLNTQLTSPEQRLLVKSKELLSQSFVEPSSLENLIENNKAANDQENWSIRALSVKDYPKSMPQWKMGELIGDIANPALQIPCPFVMSLAIHKLPTEKTKAKAELKYLSRDSKAKSPLARFLPTLSREHQDWKMVRECLTDGDKLVSTFFQVVLYAPQEAMNRAQMKVKSLFDAKGWKLVNDAYTQLQSWLAIFPMMMSEGLIDDLRQLGRLKTMTSFTAANLMPLQGEHKGSLSPGLLLTGRRGQLAWWSPFANQEGNFNVAVAASAGSGKSVLVQDYIASQLAQNGRVWVIDVGRSYEKTCKFFKGQFIEFTMESDICINPFSHLTDINEALDLLKPLFAIMARPSQKASDEEESFLEKAIKSVWEEKNQKATVTDVAIWLKEQGNPIAKNLSHLLYPYTKDGMYARFFEGENSLNMENPLIVLELEELKSKKTLQEIVLLVLMHQISQTMYCGTRHQKKTCIIDEAWDLFGSDNKNSAYFIETGYRRARRYNANFVTITQSVQDYYTNEAARAALENSDTILLLKQKKESIDQLKNSDRLTMDGYMEHLLKTLKRTNDYSECMLATGQGYSVHRLLLEPFSRILYTSKGTEFEMVKALQKEGYSLYDAVAEVARQVYGDDTNTQKMTPKGGNQ